jgi:hypothetical protein
MMIAQQFIPQDERERQFKLMVQRLDAALPHFIMFFLFSELYLL